jgi:hypothetical protein
MITAVNIEPRNKGALHTMHFNSEQTRELLNITDFALTLMQHYVAVGKQTDPILEDKQMAILLNKSIKTIERTRLLLTKAGWFKRLKTTCAGESHIIYLIGKSVVSSHNHAVIP